MTCSFSEDQLRSLIEQSQDIIIVVDATGEIAFVNSAVTDTLGYEPAEMVGTNAFEYIHPEDRDAVVERFGDLLETSGETTDRVQHRMRHRDGTTVWVESIGGNQKDNYLNNNHVINTREITELKEYEEELERQNERLDEFASVISHDLRNPLNVADGRVELAAEECDSEHLDAVARALDRMETLIEDVLELSRAGELVGGVETVDLPELADTCWENAGAGSARLVVDTDRTILADRSRLKQLLENLFRNAVEHGSTARSQPRRDSPEQGSTGSRSETDDTGERGGHAVTVVVGDLPSGFYVADDGPGIPEDSRENAFEAGYSTTDDGTGLGLNIAEQIANAHGWEIGVTDSEDGGARFEISGVDVA